MKKFIILLVFLAVSGAVFAQDVNIIDYFPCNIGNTWTYANGTGKVTDIIILKNKSPDTTARDGTSIYLVENQMLGVGSTSTLLSIKDNKVVILVTKNIMGSYQQNRPPYPIDLAPPDQEWQYNDRGDDLRLKTSRASCTVDNNIYTDCILVEERIVADNSILRTKKSYYAKGIGLVLVTLQDSEGESIFMKLIDSSIK